MHAAGGDGSCWCKDWQIGHQNDPGYYQQDGVEGWAGNCDICRAHCMDHLVTGFAYYAQSGNPDVGYCFGGTAADNCDGCDRSSDPGNPGLAPFTYNNDSELSKKKASNKAKQVEQLKSQSRQMPMKK